MRSHDGDAAVTWHTLTLVNCYMFSGLDPVTPRNTLEGVLPRVRAGGDVSLGQCKHHAVCLVTAEHTVFGSACQLAALQCAVL